jgi:predicted transcriptional regulator
MEKQPQKKSIRGRQPDGSPHPVDLHVGRRMRLRRNLLGISQETLAHKLGLTFQQVQKYERGLNRISSSRLFDISKVLNVRVSYFFDEMDEDVSAGSPLSLSLGDGSRKTADDAVADPMLREEAITLVNAFNKIKNPRLHRLIYHLVLTMGSNAERDIDDYAAVMSSSCDTGK